MTEAEYAEVRAAAVQQRMTVSEWVRSTLRTARDRGRGGLGSAVHEAPPKYGSDPLRRVRVELDIKADLLERIQSRFHLPSPRAAVEYALARTAIRPMTKEDILAMEGVGWPGDLEELRSGDAGEVW